eukprot:SRR837773.2918.p1 GENE.SRR837773.2918~~SRR837773.2918.p1  ORF type:complete len:290 (+),score=121.64 SRR837773.2918:51-872(+)
MAVCKLLGAVALTVLTGGEAGRPRPAGSASSAVEVSRVMSSLAEAVQRFDAHVKAGKEVQLSLLEYPRSDRRIASHSSSAVEVAAHEMPDGLEELSADVGSTEGVGAAPVAGTKDLGYTHYDGEAAYNHEQDIERMDKNLAIKVAPLTGADAEMKEAARLECKNADEGKDATVADLKKCLSSAYDYFKNTLTHNWSVSEKQAQHDGKIFNLMFDRLLDLANVKRSIDAFNSDETRVSGALLKSAQGLRDKINAIINRGGATGADKTAGTGDEN